MTERVEPDSSWNDPPTPDQLLAIRKYCHILNLDLTEADLPFNRLEARNMLYQLRADLNKRKYYRHIRISSRR
jgi:hypothetical protein